MENSDKYDEVLVKSIKDRDPARYAVDLYNRCYAVNFVDREFFYAACKKIARDIWGDDGANGYTADEIGERFAANVVRELDDLYMREREWEYADQQDELAFYDDMGY